MDIDVLTREILKLSLSPNQDRLHTLRGTVLDAPNFYIVSLDGEDRGSDTSAYIEQNGMLVVFLDIKDASSFASRQSPTFDPDTPPIVSMDNDGLNRLISQYAVAGKINQIKIYAHTPIGLTFTPSDFNRTAQESVFEPENVQIATRVFKGVEEVKNAFETYEINARRKIDPGARYENIHTLIQSLAQQNGIDPNELDQRLDFTDGYSRRFFLDVKTLDPSIEVMKKFLSYFGLESYLYLFRKDCRELQRYLGSHKFIDKYKLKNRIDPSAERFRLDKIIRGKDGDVFVYKVFLTGNRGGSEEFVLSDPRNPPLVVGKEYQIMERDGRPRDVDMAPQKMTSVTVLPNNEEMQALINSLDEKDLSRKTGKTSKDSGDKQPRTYDETRKDEIIKHFRKQGMDGRSALAKYRDLEVEDDILDEFYKYIQSKKFTKFEVQGYTARKLIKEMHMEPYEAFLSLVQLRTDPQETKQRLIYRERDPQYQKPPQKEDEK